MPFIISNENDSVYISQDVLSKVGGVLGTVDLTTEISAINLPFDSSTLRLLVEYIEKYCNHDTDTNRCSEVFINTLGFRECLKLFHIADFLHIDSLINVVMTIISRLTLEMTPSGIVMINHNCYIIN